jgi:hypothetical protein
VIEAVPSLLGVSGQSTAATLAAAGDLPLVSHYVPPWKVAYHFLHERIGACANHRQAVCRQLAPWATAGDLGHYDALPLERLGGTSSWLRADPTPEEKARWLAKVRAEYAPGLDRLTVHPTPDRAGRDLIDLCRRNGAEMVVLLTPESTEFRSWYSPAVARLVDDYYRELSRTTRVPVVDARGWMPDDAFTDGQHLNPRAATTFTERLARDVLIPLIDGRLTGPMSATAR